QQRKEMEASPKRRELAKEAAEIVISGKEGAPANRKLELMKQQLGDTYEQFLSLGMEEIINDKIILGQDENIKISREAEEAEKKKNEADPVNLFSVEEHGPIPPVLQEFMKGYYKKFKVLTSTED